MFQNLGLKKLLSITLGVLVLMLGVFYVAPSFEQKAFAVAMEIEDDEIEPLPPVCSYPAPPMGCRYEEGPGYNPMTNCGRVMNCGEGEDLPIEDEELPITCSYAAPPPSCNYEPGPGYDPVTGCGMILACTTYTVTFTGSTGGVVTGNLSQQFSPMGGMELEGGGGVQTTPVQAIPNSGYAFYGWSNGSFMNPLVVSNVSSNMSFVASFIQAQLYTDPNGVYSFYYPFGLQYKHPATAGTIKVVFTKYGNTYASLAPVITVAKGPSDRSLSQVVAGVSTAYRKLFRNNYSVTTEIERTAHGVPTKQLHITGKIAGVDKTFIITFIRLLSQVYVVSANGTLANASTLDSIVDTIISTRKFAPIPAGVDGNPTCMFCE